MDASAWIELGRTFGFSALVVLIMLVGLYRLGKLYIEQVAVPMSNRLIASVDHTDKAIDEQTEVLRVIRNSLSEMNLRMARIEGDRQAEDQRHGRRGE